jgi:phytanoyl-CoA hydroxylase
MEETPYPLSPHQIDFYRENGYVQLLDVLTSEELRFVREQLDDVNRMTLDSGHDLSAGRPEYERVFVQKVNLWTVHDGMRRYVFSPKIAEIARQLVGTPRVRLWHDHALIKMPGDSKESSWHQDLPYWPMNEPGALSCWMALDDVDERNGCMQFVPKSYTWGKFEPIRLAGETQDLFSMVPEPETKDLTPVVMRMPAGSCTFHHGLTFHYATRNQTDRPRRAMVTIYMPDGITYNGRGHIVTDGLGLTIGDPIEGEMFPILAEEKA